MANAHVIAKSFLLFVGSAKLYIPSAIENQIISVMTGVIVMSAANDLALEEQPHPSPNKKQRFSYPSP